MSYFSSRTFWGEIWIGFWANCTRSWCMYLYAQNLSSLFFQLSSNRFEKGKKHIPACDRHFLVRVFLRCRSHSWRLTVCSRRYHLLFCSWIVFWVHVFFSFSLIRWSHTQDWWPLKILPCSVLEPSTEAWSQLKTLCARVVSERSVFDHSSHDKLGYFSAWSGQGFKFSDLARLCFFSRSIWYFCVPSACAAPVSKNRAEPSECWVIRQPFSRSQPSQAPFWGLFVELKQHWVALWRWNRTFVADKKTWKKRWIELTSKEIKCRANQSGDLICTFLANLWFSTNLRTTL